MCRTGTRKGKIKLKKRLLSILLAALMVLSAVPLGLVDTAWAATVVDSGSCGDNTTWKLTSDGTLTISGTGHVSGSGHSAPWESRKNEIKKVVIGREITLIVPLTGSTFGAIAYHGMFEDCTNLTDFYVEQGNPNYQSIGGVLCSKPNADNQYKTTLLLYPGGRTDSYSVPAGVDTIGSMSFAYSKVVSVTIPNGVKSVRDGAFYLCKNLESVSIGKDVSDIFATAESNEYGDSAEGCFDYCQKLKSITVDPQNRVYEAENGVLYNKGKTKLLHCAAGVSGSLIVPDSVVEINSYAFLFCRLSAVMLPQRLRTINHSTFYGSHLNDLTIPKSVTTIGSSAFGYCKYLSSVYYDGSAADWNAISVDEGNDKLLAASGNGTLYYNTAIPTGVSEDGLTWSVSRAGVLKISGTGEMFDGYYAIKPEWSRYGNAITEIDIAEGVSTIGTCAFENVRAEKVVRIPLSVKFIGGWAFRSSGNLSLTDVYYAGTASDWAKVTIEDGNEDLTNATLHCAKSAPAAPVVKIGNSASSGKPMLTWNTVEGATSYRIYRSTSRGSGYSLLGTTTATSYTNTGAKAGTTYYYRVKACNDAGLSPYSNIVSGQVKSVTPKPSAPVVKIGHSAASGKPMLTWNAVSGATSYKVYRATSQKGTYSLLGTVTATSYTNTGAKAGTTYYYKVKAVNSAGESAYSNTVSGRATVTTLTMGHSASSGKPQLTWKAVSGAASYKVYRATAKNGAYSVINTTKALTYTNVGAALGTTYYYKVEALNASGKSMGFSAIVEGKVAPVLAVGYSSVSGKPQLTWKAVPGATEYQVYRATQQNSGYTKINTTTATSYVNTGAKAGTTYYYRIVAVKGTAVSDFSNIVSARPGK